MNEYILNDTLWAIIYKILKSYGHVRVKDEILTRLFVDSILYAAQTGCHWRTLPPRYGKWNSIFKRFRDWVVFGVFDYLHNEMLNYNIENDSGKEFIKILNLAMLKTDTYSVIYKNNIAFI